MWSLNATVFNEPGNMSVVNGFDRASFIAFFLNDPPCLFIMFCLPKSDGGLSFKSLGEFLTLKPGLS